MKKMKKYQEAIIENQVLIEFIKNQTQKVLYMEQKMIKKYQYQI